MCVIQRAGDGFAGQGESISQDRAYWKFVILQRRNQLVRSCAVIIENEHLFVKDENVIIKLSSLLVIIISPLVCFLDSNNRCCAALYMAWIKRYMSLHLSISQNCIHIVLANYKRSQSWSQLANFERHFSSLGRNGASWLSCDRIADMTASDVNHKARYVKCICSSQLTSNKKSLISSCESDLVPKHRIAPT